MHTCFSIQLFKIQSSKISSCAARNAEVCEEKPPMPLQVTEVKAKVAGRVQYRSGYLLLQFLNLLALLICEARILPHRGVPESGSVMGIKAAVFGIA